LRKWGLDVRHKASFVGISNWNIDASKMNRNVYLARPDLDPIDLFETGRTILTQKSENLDHRSNKFNLSIRNVVLFLANSYSEFRRKQKVTGLHFLLYFPSI
jgi:hypothetical protein